MAAIQNKIQRIREERKKIQREVGERTIGYVLAAFGLVAGLAWNDAIRSLIEYFFPIERAGILAKIIYAVVITAVVVVFSIYLAKLADKKN